MMDQTEHATLLDVAAATWGRQLARALARAAEVDAKPDAQPWEIERVRDSVETARRAVAVNGLALAVARTA